MTAPNIYLPYPIPQSQAELKEDMNTLIYQPGVPQELQDIKVVLTEPEPTSESVKKRGRPAKK